MSSDSPSSRLIIGIQPVREAVKAQGQKLLRVAVEQDPSPKLQAVERFAKDQGVPEIVRLPRSDLDRLTRGARHQGVVAWANALEILSADELLSALPEITIALDRVQDPQNFGAVVRSAVGVAGAVILWGEHSTAPLTPATFRASAGAVEHARLCRVPSLPGILTELKTRGALVVGLDAQASAVLDEIPLQAPLVLVLGSEEAGLGRAVKAQCSTLARLAVTSRVASLNASVAGGIALYVAKNKLAKLNS